MKHIRVNSNANSTWVKQHDYECATNQSAPVVPWVQQTARSAVQEHLEVTYRRYATRSRVDRQLQGLRIVLHVELRSRICKLHVY